MPENTIVFANINIMPHSNSDTYDQNKTLIRLANILFQANNQY